MKSRILVPFALSAAVLACSAQAQTAASAPYTPSWQARHHLQLLVDHAGLALPLTHWPLPAAAVEQALADLPASLDSRGLDLQGARDAVLRELGTRHTQASLRLQLRGMLDKGHRQQRQLAALDAIFDNVLMAREAQLLGQITTAFEKRFARSLRQHMKALVQAAQADEPAPRTEPWLAPLRQDLLNRLLAELDLRLQPILGLIEALTQDTAETP